MSDVQTFKTGDRVITTGIGQTRHYRYDSNDEWGDNPALKWNDEDGWLNGPGATGTVLGGPDGDGECVIVWDDDPHDHSGYADPRTLALVNPDTTAPNAKASFVAEPVFPDVMLRLTYEEARTMKIAAAHYGLTDVLNALESVLSNSK